jgi:hypothetical protein
VLGVVIVGGMAQWAAAQRRDAPRIIIAPVIEVAPASQAPLPIQVGPPDALPSNSFVRLRGFPTSVSLTEGHAIAPGAWAIPLFGRTTLRAIVPAGVSGRAEIMVTLVGVDGRTLAEARTALVIADPPERSPVATLPTPTPQVRKVVPQVPSLSQESRARAERMLVQGAKHLEQGNIGAARSFFQRAADAGLAEAALKLGATYDPTELTRIDALAVTADRNEARKWYERARELGALEADDRLGRLSGR